MMQGCPCASIVFRIGMAVRASSRSPPELLIRGQAWGRPFRTCSGMAAIAHSAASLHEVRIRRGVHDPSGPHHGHRPVGRHWPLGDDRVGSRLARCRGPASAVCLPAARERARRRGATGARGRGAARPASVGDRRRLRGRRRLSCRRPGPRCGSRDGIAPGGAAPLGEQQGLLHRRSVSALRPRGPRPPRARRVRPCRSHPPAPRPRGRLRSQPHLAPRPWVKGPGSNHIGVTVGKNVAVFVDVANIFYAAKSAGVDIDYVTLLKSATAGRDFVRAYAYTGLDPDNENQRNFHSFLARNSYKVVSKDIRKYGDGKVKANLDIELVVDLMKTARNLDIAIVVSGDGDFAPAIRAVQEMGVRCEVISFRGNTSSDLIEVADLFTDITQLARVEKGSRSGRRVADDDADLSMTEVPDKQTEGTGLGRGGRGRGGRGRGRSGEAEPVAASGSRSRGGRG